MPGRKLIKEGILMKVSQKSDKGKPRHFVLMTDALMCCKIKSDKLHCSCILPLRKCSIENILGRGLFNISAPGQSLMIYSEDYHVSDEWIEAITNAKSQVTLKFYF